MAAPCLQMPNRNGRERAKRPPGSSVREAPFKLVRDATVDGQPNDGLTLDGYGAVFNRQTLIDSWEGRFWEQIAPGSMKRSFRDTPPKIQFDHGRHPLIGSLPVASLVSVTEDSDPELAPDGGAHIIGRLLDNWLVQPVRDAIASGVVDGMSFRFEVLQESWVTADGKPIRDEVALMRELDRVFLEDLPDDQLPVRTLKQLKVPEMGPVTWPAYDDTSVGVRSKVIDLGRLNEPGQRKLLARAVWMADRLEAQPDAQRDAERDVDTPIDDADPDKIAAHASSLDAILDEASELVGKLDVTMLPPEVAQIFALVQGAGTVSDQLLDTLGVYDPDDDDEDDSDEDDSGRSGQQVTEQADQHPTGEQRTTSQAGAHSDRQQATPSGAGAHQPIRGTRDIDLWVQKSRDNLLSIQARKGMRT